MRAHFKVLFRNSVETEGNHKIRNQESQCSDRNSIRTPPIISLKRNRFNQVIQWPGLTYKYLIR
jgi:hypothetical protein